MLKKPYNKTLRPLIFPGGKLWFAGLAILFLTMASLSMIETDEDGELTLQNDYLSELIKAYNTLSFYGGQGSYFTINELTSDEMVVPVRGGDWFDGGLYLRLHKHEYLPSEVFVNATWQVLYNGVLSCNKQLFQYSKITGPGTEMYVAELKVLRAWYYYLLLDTFGNVPLVTDYFPATPDLPSSNTSTEIFDFIEAEIVASLPDLSAAPVYGRFNQSAAKAILAKLYLNANTYIGTDMWVEAEAECDDIILSGYYSLTLDYFDNFEFDNQNSTEIIFQIPYQAGTLPGFNIGQMTLHYSSQATFNLQTQPWNGYSAVEDFYNSFEVTDARKGQFLVGPQVDLNSDPIIDPIDDGDPDGTAVDYTPEIADINNAYRQAGVRIHKWKYELGAGADLNNDFGIFRFSDVLLMKAETRLRQADEPTALSLVNQVRDRAGLDDWLTVSLTDLLAERGRELFAETWRRQDLIRFGVYNSAWWEKPASSAHLKIFPIPQPQIDANPNLTQNPGY